MLIKVEERLPKAVASDYLWRLYNEEARAIDRSWTEYDVPPSLTITANLRESLILFYVSL